LHSGWSARELSDQFLWKEGVSTTLEDTWQRIEGPKGLWAMYQNARVMLEIADFAARNNPLIDRTIIEELRRDALQIRMCALLGLSQYGLSEAQEGVREHAYRAAETYTGMAARLTHLLQEHAATILPDFVAAM
jgi:hypothetical protein